MMEEKWFIFMKGNRLLAHRSWTGLGVYEATFAPIAGGYVITSAIVTGDETRYDPPSDQDETLLFEMLIASYLLGDSTPASQLTDQDPVLAWELAVPTFPKGSLILPVVERSGPVLTLHMGESPPWTSTQS